MALLGGGVGGAGNPVGGSFTGPAEALEIVGDFAYAYNQVATSDLQGTPSTTLQFTTGNYLFVGEWTVAGAVKYNAISGSGSVDQFYLSLNGSVVMSLRTDTDEEDMPGALAVPIIIPPWSEVELKAACGQNDSDWFVSNTLTGRIYRE